MRLFDKLFKRKPPQLIGPTGSLPWGAFFSSATAYRSIEFWRGIFFACVEMRAHGIAEAMTGARVERILGQSEYEMVEPSHPWAALLRRPSRSKSAYMLWYWVSLMRDITGSCYLIVERDQLGRPIRLWPLEPAWGEMLPLFDSSGYISEYEFWSRTSNKRVRYKAADVIDLSSRSPTDSRETYSLLDKLFYELKSDFLQHYVRASQLEKGGIPPLYIRLDRPISEVAIKRMEQEFKERFLGFRNITEIPVLVSAEIRNVGEGMRDREFAVSAVQIGRRIMMACGVPESLMGAEANRAGVEAARAVFYQQTVMPMARLLAEQLTLEFEEAFRADPGALRIRPVDLIPVDGLTRAQVRQLEVMIGVKSPNEIRREDGLEPYEGGDQFFMAANLQPVLSRISPVIGSLSFRSSPDELEEAIKKALLSLEEATVALIQQKLREIEEELDEIEDQSDLAVILSVGALGLSAQALARAAKERAASELRAIASVLALLLGVEQQEVLQEALKAESNLTKLSDFISDSLREEISKTIAQGISEGLGRDALIELLKDKLKDLSEAKARVWARSLATATTNAATFASFRVAGVTYKTWNSLLDGRERPHHNRAHGQRRRIDEPFEVNGELLMYPGDVSLGASASNIANCRCFITTDKV